MREEESHLTKDQGVRLPEHSDFPAQCEVLRDFLIMVVFGPSPLYRNGLKVKLKVGDVCQYRRGEIVEFAESYADRLVKKGFVQLIEEERHVLN